MGVLGGALIKLASVVQRDEDPVDRGRVCLPCFSCLLPLHLPHVYIVPSFGRLIDRLLILDFAIDRSILGVHALGIIVMEVRTIFGDWLGFSIYG